MAFRQDRQDGIDAAGIRRILRTELSCLHSPRARIRMAGQLLDQLRTRLRGRDLRDPLVAALFREFAACITAELPALLFLPGLTRITDSPEEREDAAAAGIALLWRYMLRHHGTGQAPIFSDCCYAYLERCIVNAARDMLRLKIRQRQQEQQLEAAGTLVSMQQGSGAGSIAELFFWCRMAMQGERNERNREILVARLMQLWLSAEGYSCRLAEVRRLLAERGIEIGEHALRQQANRLLGRLRQRVDNSMIEAMDMEAR